MGRGWQFLLTPLAPHVSGPAESRMTRARLVRIAVTVVVLVCLYGYRSRNPEKRELTAAAQDAQPGTRVTLPEGRTSMDVSGPDDGEKVMLVHGFSVPSYIWDSTVVALTAAGFRVARYDTWGRGWSDRPDVTYDLGLYERQLLGVLDSLGWRDPVHIAGLSFGGPVTATFTSRHPERVRSLTLVDPAAGSIGGAPWMFKLPLVGPALWQVLAVPTMADGQLGDFVEPAKWAGWPDKYRPQTQYKGFGRALLRTRRATAGISSDSMYAAAGATGKPTLLIWGTKDTVVPIAEAEGVRKAIPHVQYHPIDGAGHLPHMEQSALVHATMVRFMRPPAGSTTTTETKP